ncbi:hypothetical protein FOMPIDRAFT_91291 [Fomitopsis schrenkii]|uniref:Uncharacterized protein n=1 Tax=Fomitopsis schrenkii TaxID=2126942 RepID=S8DUB3_FOMSC|nr:hypothetical protein FOMPIDRAFT_91291 [Fomitopsis schrenkii]
MSTQTYSGEAHRIPATTARKNWREIYAQKRAKHNDPRYLRTGCIHEDINEAAHIWRVKIQTVTEPASVDNAKEQRMVDGRVPTAVATPNIPRRASAPTVAYSGAWDAWLRSYMREGGLSGARYDAGEAIETGGGYLKYAVGEGVPGSVVNGSGEEAILATASTEDAKIGNDNSIPRVAFAREMHHRTPSTSTASSSSLKTEHDADWWEVKTPCAWQ